LLIRSIFFLKKQIIPKCTKHKKHEKRFSSNILYQKK